MQKPIHKNDWEGFQVPKIEETTYGIKFPNGIQPTQLLIESTAFKQAWDLKKGNIKRAAPGVQSAFYHALKMCQLLWNNDIVEIEKNGALNTYFLDVLTDCCEFDDLSVTGPASAAKTYSCAVFALLCFISRPTDFMCLISTTSGKAADRRVWADVKKLHRGLKLEQNGFGPIGEVLEYLSCIVFNHGKSVGDKMNARDFRQGIMVVPVASDSTGDAALDTIMGSKNKYVLWIVDEGPAMPSNIMAPRTNLEYNPNFQFIMVGNANDRNDPHGRSCEHIDGWKMVDPSMKRWRGKTLNVLFLHGECSPNDYYAPDAETKSEIPFPYLSNKFARDKAAEVEGNGDVDHGRETLGYWRFAIGYWMGSDMQQTVLSENFVKINHADEPAKMFGAGRPRTFAALDPAFTAGGDNISLMFATVGNLQNGKTQLLIDSESVHIKPIVKQGTSFEKSVAKEVVRLCKERNVNPQDFGGDISADGGIIFNAIAEEWGLSGFQLLSSLQSSSLAKYANKVSQYWMQVRELIQTGVVRGFNIHSNYARDLFERRFTDESKTFKVERKKDFKKRTGRSPDDGDSFAYLTHLIMKSGLVSSHNEENEREERSIDEQAYYHDKVGRYRGESYDDGYGEFSDSYVEVEF